MKIGERDHGFILDRQTPDPTEVYISDFRSMKNVLAGRNERALYKLVTHGETDVVLGLHMIGPDAPEILTVKGPTVMAAAPEPTLWATMLLGFGLAGTMLRRRRVRVGYAG